MNTEEITNSKKIFSAFTTLNNKFIAANIEYDYNNFEFIESYKFTDNTASILAELCLSSLAKQGTNKAYVLTGPYGTGKSHLLLQYMALISDSNKDVVVNISTQIKKLNLSNEKSKIFLKALNSNQIPKLLPVVVKTGFTNLRNTLIISLQQTLDNFGLSQIMPDIYGIEANAVIERWANKFPETYNAFCNKLSSTDSIEEYCRRLIKLHEPTYQDFCQKYSELTSGSKFIPQNTAEPLSLYTSMLASLRNHGFDGITIIFDEFSKYLETGLRNIDQSETKLLQDFAEFASRTSLKNGSVLNFILVTHKDISNYITHLPKTMIDGWRGVAERFTILHMPQSLEQSATLLSEATGANTQEVHEYLTNTTSIIDKQLSCLGLELKNLINRDFVYKVFPLHCLTAYFFIKLSENIGQNERSIYAFMSDKGKNSYSEKLNEFGNLNEILLTPEIAFDYFAEKIREQIYDQDCSRIYEIYQKSVYLIRELNLTDSEKFFAFRIIKTIAIAELLKIDFISTDILLQLYGKNINKILNLLINSNVLTKHIVTGTIKLSRPETSSADIILKNKINELSLKNISDSELCQSIIAPELFLYPELYNDENHVIRYFKTEFLDYNYFTSDKFNFAKKKQDFPGVDGFVYFIFGCDNSVTAINNIKRALSNLKNNSCFINISIPINNGKLDGNSHKLLLTLKAIDLILNDPKKTIAEEIKHILLIIKEEIHINLGDYLDLLTTCEESINAFCSFVSTDNITKIAYKFRNSDELSDALSDLCSNVFSNYLNFRNEMVVCTNPSRITKSAIKDVIRAIFNKSSNSRFKDFSMTSQQMTLIKSILVEPRFIELTSNNDYIAIVSNNKIANYILNWFTNASSGKNLRELVEDLTSTRQGFGIKIGIIPLITATVICPVVNSIVIINKKQKNIETDFNTDLFLSMFDDEQSIDNFKIKYKKYDNFFNVMRKCIGKVFIANISDNEIPSLDKVSEAINNWFLKLPKFSRSTIIKKVSNDEPHLFSQINDIMFANCGSNLSSHGIDEEIAKEFLKKIAAYAMVNPRQKYYEELPKLLNINKTTTEIEIKNKLEAIKFFYNSALENLYILLESIVIRHWDCTNTNIKVVAYNYASKLKCNDDSHKILYKEDVQYILSYVNNDKFNANSFISKLARIITKLNIKEWDIAQYQIFENEIKFLGSTYLEELNKKNCKTNDLANLSVNKLLSTIQEFSKDNVLTKNYIFRELDAVFTNYNLSDRQIIEILLQKIMDKLHPTN